MSPRTKKQLVNVTAALGAVVGAGGWALRSSARAIDDRYVHTTTFLAYQQGQAIQRHDDSTANAQRDTLLRRVDARVGAIYCGSLPLKKRAGCQ